MESGGKPPSDMEWQVLKEVSLNPVTLYGAALGVGCILFGSLILSVIPQLAVWTIIFGLVTSSVGVLNWMINYFFRYETIADQCLKRFARTAEEERQREIQILRQQLMADGDARTEKLLDDLLTLTTVFQNVKQWNIDSYSQFEITRKVNALFEEGIKHLEQTLHLWHTAQSLNSGSIREAIVHQREELIRDLAESVNQFGTVLRHLQEMTIQERTQPLSDIVQELDATMTIARRVQERMGDFDPDKKIIVS